MQSDSGKALFTGTPTEGRGTLVIPDLTKIEVEDAAGVKFGMVSGERLREQFISAYAALLIPPGTGQSWQDMSASRTNATAYQNTTSAPIDVNVHYVSSNLALMVSTDNITWVVVSYMHTSSSAVRPCGSATIPIGHYYKIDEGANGATVGTLNVWAELRA